MNEAQLPTVDIVTVLWNSAGFMPQFFAGIAASDYPRERLRLHVVDNNPGEGSLAEVRRQMERLVGQLPEIIIHEPHENTGFAGGNNLVMRQAIEQGRDYVYLLNHDAILESSALREAILVAESDRKIGSVQSLIVLAQNTDEVNSTGNEIHYLGFGYCGGYHEKRNSVPLDVKDIAYASGAAVLFPTRILKDIGLLDEVLWLYHEDLDLGWRILLGGYRNVLAPKSVVQHHYEFSRSIQKWYWMERNRIIVVLKNYRLGTLMLLMPQLIVLDFALWIFALKGGWWNEKVRAMDWFYKPSTWKYLSEQRKQIAKTRRVSDKQILQHFTPVVAYQEFESPLISAIVNPAWRILFAIVKVLVIW